MFLQQETETEAIRSGKPQFTFINIFHFLLNSIYFYIVVGEMWQIQRKVEVPTVFNYKMYFALQQYTILLWNINLNYFLYFQ